MALDMQVVDVTADSFEQHAFEVTDFFCALNDFLKILRHRGQGLATDS